MQKPAANRVVTFIGGALLLVMALSPVIANMDWKSTAGVLAGIPALALVIYKWLEGWQRWESPETFQQPASVALETHVVAPPDGPPLLGAVDDRDPALDPDLDGETFALDGLDAEHEKRDLHEADPAIEAAGEL